MAPFLPLRNLKNLLLEKGRAGKPGFSMQISMEINKINLASRKFLEENLHLDYPFTWEYF